MKLQSATFKQFSVIAVILGLLNGLIFQQGLVGIILLSIVVLYCSHAYGHRLFKQHHLTFGFLVTLCFLSLAGSAVYYTLPVNQLTLGIVLGLIYIPALFLKVKDIQISIQSWLTPKDFLLFTSGSLSIIAWWATIQPATITAAVRTPWDSINPASILFLLYAAIAAIALLQKRRVPGLVLIGATFISAASLATSVFPLGYGFDPFIHRATLRHIAEFGTITPKPLYYIGDYALELIGHLSFGIPLHTFNQWLVPGLGMLLIILSAATTYRKFQFLALFFIPIGAFILTTPQNLSYAFMAVIAILGLKREQPLPLWFFWLLAITTTVIHPLSGLPALLFVALLSAQRLIEHPPMRKAVLITGTVLGSIMMPAVFLLQAIVQDLDVHFISPKLSAALPHMNVVNHFDGFLDLLYSLQHNLFLIFLVFVIAAVFAKKWDQPHIPFIIAMLLNFFILASSIEFSFLVEYERQNYTVRLLILLQLFIAPLIAISIKKPRFQPALISLLLFVMIFFAGNIYTAYPRDDGFSRNRGFNVSQADLDAVWAIEAHAAGQEYAVLANQAMSAAALQELGFKQYFNDDVFFYPIPTGGHLYEIFLDMVENKPAPNTVLKAKDLTGTDQIYFAVHSYWDHADQIVEQAKLFTDEWFTIGQDQVTVFVFPAVPAVQ